jgi:radical SAM superfamily enzyme YgiQ (UPF0313 family)
LKRALIVNCYADETRRRVARFAKIPQPLAPAFLAGGFNPQLWELRLYNELSDGPLEDARLLAWPDLVVLTGLVTSLDRMRHVTAYVRTLQPKAIVVGGGHAVRAFPRFCRTFLDVVCLGDVEEIRGVIAGLFGEQYAAEESVPRFDLAHWAGGTVGYAETSRYCNFRCSFCTLTAEGRRYAPYPITALRRQFAALGRRNSVVLLDNNFYGNDRRSFAARLECLREARAQGQFDRWVALVSNDFFLRPENLRAVRDAGCAVLFCGVESFDGAWTSRQNKRQNSVRPQIEIIRECLEAGVVFLYGLMLDVTTRRLAEITAELELILAHPEVTLPAYLSLPIPLPGTPFFYDCLDADLILPHTRVRDLDPTTLSLRPLDPLPEVARFVHRLQTMAGFRARLARHSLGFARRYWRHLGADRLPVALANAALLCAPLLATVPRRIGALSAPRTHVSTTECLDDFYRPALAVDPRYQNYFTPLALTDGRGRPAEQVAADIEAARAGCRLPLGRRSAEQVATAAAPL